MPLFRKRADAESLPRQYGKIDLLATWRDQVENLSLLCLELNADSQTKLHAHPYEEIAVLISGRLTVQTNDASFSLDALDCIVFYADEPHKLINSSSAVCVVLLAISPHRRSGDVLYLE